MNVSIHSSQRLAPCPHGHLVDCRWCAGLFVGGYTTWRQKPPAGGPRSSRIARPRRGVR